jgi:hypothetical protein
MYREEVLLSCKACAPALGHLHISYSLHMSGFFLGVKRFGFETELYNVEVKTAWSYASTPHEPS